MEKEYEAMMQQEQQELAMEGLDKENTEETLYEKALKLPEEERMLTIRNYLEYICDDFDRDNAMFIPINTITPSELQGLSLEDERKLRVYGCELI